MMSFSDVYFTKSKPVVVEDQILDELEQGSTGFKSFMKLYSGCSFLSGLYRVHAIADIRKWSKICVDTFPSFRGRIVCFSSDWLGRQFALDFKRVESGERLVLMMEPGTGEALEIPVGFMAFHDSELVDYKEEALADSFYQKWLEAGGASPGDDQCVGYNNPLFLGGKDEVNNLELCDMEVYWSVCAQLLAKTRGLAPGTPVRDVKID
jgi:hypothetical protein